MKKDFRPLILKNLYSFAGGIVCLQVMHMDRYVSFCFYATFYLTLIFWIVCALEKMERIEFWMLIGMTIALISVLINAVLSGAMVTIQYLKKLLSFFSTLLFFSAAYKSVPNASVQRWIYGILDLVSTCLIAAFFYQQQRAYMFNGVISNYLTFGFSNPNLTGMFLAGIIILEMNRIPTLMRSWQRILAWGEVGFLIFFSGKHMLETHCLPLLFSLFALLFYLCIKQISLNLERLLPKSQQYGRFFLLEHIFCFYKYQVLFDCFHFLKLLVKALPPAWRFGGGHCDFGLPLPSSVPMHRRAAVREAVSFIIRTLIF